MINQYFECLCHSNEHTLKFSLDDNEEYPDLYASIFLIHHRNVFKRIWIAIKYVFGYKSSYGHWDEWLLRPEDSVKLRELLEKYEQIKKHSKLV